MIPSRITIALVGILAASAVQAQTADFLHNLRTEASITWAENFSRTSAVPTQKSAQFYSMDASLDHRLQLSPNWLLQASGEVAGYWVPKYTALNHFAAGAQLNLQRKFGLGPFAPVLQFHSSLTGYAVNEGGRSGWQLQGGVQLSKRLTEAWRISGGMDWTEYAARHHPFDTNQHTARLEVTWDVTDRWQFNVGGSRLWGQLTANAAGSVWAQAINGGFGPVIYEVYNRNPWAVTDTFGSGWVAYRISGHADTWWLEMAPALSDHTSLALRYETVKVINEVGIRYDSAFWSLSVVHRF